MKEGRFIEDVRDHQFSIAIAVRCGGPGCRLGLASVTLIARVSQKRAQRRAVCETLVRGVAIYLIIC